MARKGKYDDCEYTGDRACAVESFLDVLGGRWKGMILFHLLAAPPAAPVRRFGELRRLLPHVTQRMLTAQLRELERDGIVARKVYAQVPPKVEYSLTPMGAKLDPIVRLMGEWGDEYMVAYEQARKRLSAGQPAAAMSGVPAKPSAKPHIRESAAHAGAAKTSARRSARAAG